MNFFRGKGEKKRGFKKKKEREKKREVIGSYGAQQIVELLLETVIEIHEVGK